MFYSKLNTSLFLGSVYFYITAFLHFTGFKIPPFYIYYNVESTIYQDRIIAVLSFMFATFLYAGFKLKDKNIVKYILFSGSIGVFGLLLNNFITKTAFRTNIVYWLEIGFLGLYVIILYLFYKKQLNNE